MPRVKTIQKARKAQGQCGKCGCKINKGDAYRKWAFRFGGRHVRCMKPECSPKQSDLTNSPFLSTLYKIQETTFDGEDASDLESQRDKVVGELQSLLDDTQGSLDNMPEGLQQGSTGEMLQERISTLEDAINTLENVDCTIEDKEEDETDKDFETRSKDRVQEIEDELDTALADISCS